MLRGSSIMFQTLTKTRFPQSKFLDLHVFGCPAYVLKKQISDGKKIPRWEPRSTRGQHVGFSSLHSSTAPLVLNLDTGAITAQYHVVFDDWFATVAADQDDLPPFDAVEWSNMFGTKTYHEDPGTVDSDSDDDEPAPRSTNREKAFEHMERTHTQPLAPPPPEASEATILTQHKEDQTPEPAL